MKIKYAFGKTLVDGKVFHLIEDGILKNNKWNLSGEYGNGAIYVSTKDLPDDIVEWCRANFL